MTVAWIAAATSVVLSCAPAQVFAQSDPTPLSPGPAPSSAPPPAADATASSAVPAGSVVDVEVAEAVSSKVVKIGDKFAIRLAYPIVKDGKVVIPAGTMGVGQVIDAAPAGALGKPAKLLLAARYLDVGGAQIKLRTFQLGRVGVDNSGAIMALSFVPYAGLAAMFMRGGEIEVPAGTRGQAKLVDDLPLPSTANVAPKAPNEGPKQP